MPSNSKLNNVEEGTFQNLLADENITSVAVVSAVLIVFFSIFIILLIRGRRSKRRTLLLAGVSDAGKTALFSKLVFSKESETFTSIKDNSGFYTVKEKGLDVPVVDIPGNEKQRLQFWEKYKDEIRGMIFMVDSSKFQKEVKEVAEFLYVLLTDPSINRSRLKLLMACNKQDIAVSKSAKVIQTQLEKELNTLRVTQAATLDSTDHSNQSSKYILGKEGKSFEFSHLSPIKVEFTECICKGSMERSAEIATIQDWIKKVAK